MRRRRGRILKRSGVHTNRSRVLDFENKRASIFSKEFCANLADYYIFNEVIRTLVTRAYYCLVPSPRQIL
jgi:hypothetical protein